MKKLYLILAILCVIASIAMYQIGSNNSALTELKDYFWSPLVLAFVFGAAFFQNK